MKEPEGLFGKLISQTMPDKEVREFMEWLYILIFFGSIVMTVVTKFVKQLGSIELDIFTVLYAGLLVFLYFLKKRVQQNLQKSEINKRYGTWIIFSLSVTWFGMISMIILIGLLWLGLPLSENCPVFGGCLQDAQKFDCYVFLSPFFISLLAVIPPTLFLKSAGRCLYIEELSWFLFDKEIKRVVIIAIGEKDEREAIELARHLKKRNLKFFFRNPFRSPIEAFVVASDYQKIKDLKPEFIVIVYKDCPKSWLTSQWQLNQKVLPTKKGFLPEENMLMFADSRKIDWDDDFFKSFEFFPNQEEKKEMVLLRKSSSKKSSLGE